MLVHGATYNHTYWDFPEVNSRAYSYARYMAAPERKYTVLAIDQLAAGQQQAGKRPGSHTLETATILKQVIDQMLSVENGQTCLNRIVPAATPPVRSTRFRPVGGTRRCAGGDRGASYDVAPVLARDPGSSPFVLFLASLPYFPLPPDLRALLFYYPPAADPAVMPPTTPAPISGRAVR